MIRFEDVEFSYAGGPPVLEGLTFALAAKQNLSVVGPSGCGKSTLLNLLLGAARPARGKVFFMDKEILGPSRDRMIVFQHHALFPWLTALGNVRFSLETQTPLSPGADEQALHWLRRFGLEKFRDYYPRELSGGMQQRLGIARALASSPRLLLLDEPFSSLDAILRRSIFEDMTQMIRVEEKTAVLVTHDVSEALRFAERILILGGRRSIFGESSRFTEEEIYAHWKT